MIYKKTNKQTTLIEMMGVIVCCMVGETMPSRVFINE